MQITFLASWGVMVRQQWRGQTSEEEGLGKISYASKFHPPLLRHAEQLPIPLVPLELSICVKTIRHFTTAVTRMSMNEHSGYAAVPIDFDQLCVEFS